MFRKYWVSVPPFTDLFGGHVQEEMLANVKSFKSRWEVRDTVSNPQGSIVRRGESDIISKFQSYIHLEGASVLGVISSEWQLLCLWVIVLMIMNVMIFISKWAWDGWEKFLSMPHGPIRRANQEMMFLHALPSICSFCSLLSSQSDELLSAIYNNNNNKNGINRWFCCWTESRFSFEGCGNYKKLRWQKL